MKSLLLASLLLSSLTAQATPDDPPGRAIAPPPTVHLAATCKPGKDVVIQIDTKSLEPKTTAGSQFTLYSSGAWTYASHFKQKLLKKGRGCVAPIEVTMIQQLLAAATWSPTFDEVTCAAVGTTLTEFRIGAKLLGDQTMCDGKSYDAATAMVMQHVQFVRETLIDPVK